MVRLKVSTLVLGMTMMAVSAPAVAEGDAKKGAKVFRKCKACHVVDSDKNKVGPHLQNLLGRKPGTIEGFKYSKPMIAFGEDNVWDAENLSAFLEKPKKFIKGSKMTFGGIRKEKDRDNIIAYLMTFSE